MLEVNTLLGNIYLTVKLIYILCTNKFIGFSVQSKWIDWENSKQTFVFWRNFGKYFLISLTKFNVILDHKTHCMYHYINALTNTLLLKIGCKLYRTTFDHVA